MDGHVGRYLGDNSFKGSAKEMPIHRYIGGGIRLITDIEDRATRLHRADLRKSMHLADTKGAENKRRFVFGFPWTSDVSSGPLFARCLRKGGQKRERRAAGSPESEQSGDI